MVKMFRQLASSAEDFLNDNGYTVIAAVCLFILLSFINTVMMEKGGRKRESDAKVILFYVFL